MRLKLDLNQSFSSLGELLGNPDRYGIAWLAK
jgi:hypothetical protein